MYIYMYVHVCEFVCELGRSDVWESWLIVKDL